MVNHIHAIQKIGYQENIIYIETDKQDIVIKYHYDKNGYRTREDTQNIKDTKCNRRCDRDVQNFFYNMIENNGYTILA